MEDLKQLAKFRLRRHKIQSITRIIVMNDTPDPENWAITWSNFIKEGEKVSFESKSNFGLSLRSVTSLQQIFTEF